MLKLRLWTLFASYKIPQHENIDLECLEYIINVQTPSMVTIPQLQESKTLNNRLTRFRVLY